MAAGRHPERPFCLVAQPGVVDPSRAPAGQQTLWGYCHVPSGSTVDMSGRIEAQIERFAPGFRDLILARSVRTAAEMEQHNPNYVGGDISGGVGDAAADGVPAHGRGGTRTAPRCAASTCARRPPRPAAGCTGCAATGRPGRPSPTWACGP